MNDTARESLEASFALFQLAERAAKESSDAAEKIRDASERAWEAFALLAPAFRGAQVATDARRHARDSQATFDRFRAEVKELRTALQAVAPAHPLVAPAEVSP